MFEAQIGPSASVPSVVVISPESGSVVWGAESQREVKGVVRSAHSVCQVGRVVWSGVVGEEYPCGSIR